MKFIDKMEPIVKARQNYDVITRECQLYLQSLQKFQVAFKNLSDLDIPEVPTIPNTSFDRVVNEHLNSLLRFSQAFKDFTISLQDDCQTFEKIYQLRQNQRDSKDNDIKALNNNIFSLLDKNNQGSIPDLYDQLYKKTAALKKLCKTKNCPKNDIMDAYNNYSKDLLDYKSKKFKLNKMVDKMQSLIENYIESIRTLESSSRGQLVSEGLRSISIHLNDLGNNIGKSVSSLRAERLDFDNDFKAYREFLNIEFTNIQFAPFNSYSPVRSPGSMLQKSDDVNIYPYQHYILPEYIAQLKAEFKGENANELTVRKGQKVGVLTEKEPSKGWTLCKNLTYKTFGYIPTDFLEKVGQGIVVVKNDLNIDGFDGYSGKILSYISNDGEDKILCEDYCGKRASVPLCDVIVLY